MSADRLLERNTRCCLAVILAPHLFIHFPVLGSQSSGQDTVCLSISSGEVLRARCSLALEVGLVPVITTLRIG